MQALTPIRVTLSRKPDTLVPLGVDALILPLGDVDVVVLELVQK